MIREVHEALLDGFTPDTLERLLAFHFETDLGAIVDLKKGFENQAYQVVSTARRENWLDDLVVAMKEENPDNPKVSGLGVRVSQEYNGLSSQIRGLSQDIYKLRSAVFGDAELKTQGILEKLRHIEERINKLAEDVQRIEATLQAMTRTIPDRGLFSEKGTRLFAGLLLLTTFLSLIISALVSLGVLGG